MPDYPAWYSRLKEEYTLKLSEWVVCKRLFKQKGMRTFADWLRYYTNLDVAPGLEALERMRAFYTEKGIDILKDKVSIPGLACITCSEAWLSGARSFTAPAKKHTRC